MNPTKNAFDPCFLSSEFPDAALLNNFRLCSTNDLASQLRVADLIRSLQANGRSDLAIKAAAGNEIKVRFFISMIGRFEKLMQKGWGFSAALWQMLAEKWLVDLSNFDSLE